MPLSQGGRSPPAASGRFALQNCACFGCVFTCPPPAGVLLCKTAPAVGWRLPARRQRALCLAKPCLPWAGVCPPAALAGEAAEREAESAEGALGRGGENVRRTAPARGFGRQAALLPQPAPRRFLRAGAFDISLCAWAAKRLSARLPQRRGEAAVRALRARVHRRGSAPLMRPEKRRGGAACAAQGRAAAV